MKYRYADHIPFYQKLNFNCPKSYKDGEGEGSCKGYKPDDQKDETNAKQKSKLDKPSPSQEPSKSKSIISSKQDYKSASNEDKLAFLESEIAKGKKSTSLSDGTLIKNISGKVRDLKKKIGYNNSNNISTKPLSPEKVAIIKETKSILSKVKSEKAKTGKVSKQSVQELKKNIVNLKQLQLITNTPESTSEVSKLPATNNINSLYITKHDNILKGIDASNTSELIKVSESFAKENLSDSDYVQLSKMVKYLTDTNGDDSNNMVYNTIRDMRKRFVSENDHLDERNAVKMFNDMTFFVRSKINNPSKFNKLTISDDKVRTLVSDSQKYITGYEKYFKSYTSTEYEAINTVLCGADCSNKLSYVDDTLNVMNSINNLDSAFNNSSLPFETTVYRGVSERQIKNLLGNSTDLSSLIGKSVVQPVFASTSRKLKKAQSFAHEKHGYVYEITLPKGSKAIALDTISEFPDEEEILLNRNSELLINSIDESKRPPIIKLTYKN